MTNLIKKNAGGISKLVAITVVAMFVFSACSDDKGPVIPKAKKKIFFLSNAFDYIDHPNVIVNVYVDEVLIGTLTESSNSDSYKKYFNPNTDTSSTFAILYEMDKDVISYRYETIPSELTHYLYTFEYAWFGNTNYCLSFHNYGFQLKKD